LIAIEPVDALDFKLGADTWDFTRQRASEIDAHWALRLADQPHLFNGRVLMLGPHRIETRGAARVLTGTFLETDFKNFLAWREFGFPAANARNGFSMAALRGADGAFLLGEMAPHTASAGAVYFPAGTPDRSDVFGEVVDLDASVRRELFEETGLRATAAEIAPGWTVVSAPGRVACMKPMRLSVTAADARAQIEATLAAEAQPEFSRIHIVRSPADFTDAMPEFVRAYMARVFES
jgi:8-oxo-dGTP pyrophosphatase MutT (NUDIX family)